MCYLTDSVASLRLSMAESRATTPAALPTTVVPTVGWLIEEVDDVLQAEFRAPSVSRKRALDGNDAACLGALRSSMDLGDGRLSDVTLLAFDRRYRLHRSVLARSPVLAQLLCGTAWADSLAAHSDGEITLKFDSELATATGLEMVLRCLYMCPKDVCGCGFGIADVLSDDRFKPSDAAAALAVADQLQLVRIAQLCVTSVLLKLFEVGLGAATACDATFPHLFRRRLRDRLAWELRDSSAPLSEQWTDVSSDYLGELFSEDCFAGLRNEGDRLELIVELCARRRSSSNASADRLCARLCGTVNASQLTLADLGVFASLARECRVPVTLRARCSGLVNRPQILAFKLNCAEVRFDVQYSLVILPSPPSPASGSQAASTSKTFLRLALKRENSMLVGSLNPGSATSLYVRAHLRLVYPWRPPLVSSRSWHSATILLTTSTRLAFDIEFDAGCWDPQMFLAALDLELLPKATSVTTAATS